MPRYVVTMREAWAVEKLRQRLQDVGFDLSREISEQQDPETGSLTYTQDDLEKPREVPHLSENAVILEVDRSKVRCWPLLIHLADGRQILFPEIAPCEPPKLRELANESLGLFMEALAVAIVSDSDGEVIRHFVETVDLALKLPQFVEALKQRGAVILGPGETMEEENLC